MTSLIYRAYCAVRYTREENAQIFEVRNRHAAVHWKNLVAGAFPIFTAATISRAVVAVISAITEDENLEISLSFIYAFVFAQMLGYAIIYWVPTSNVSALILIMIVCFPTVPVQYVPALTIIPPLY